MSSKTYERALTLLSARSRSAKGLKKRLLEKGEPAADVEVVIARLLANGLLDDARYAEARARAAVTGKARSKRRTLMDLADKGVARDVAEAALARVMEEEGEDEASVAERAARKKLRSLSRQEPEVRRQKLYAFLARQGYPADVTRKVLRRVLDAPPPDEDEIG